MAERMAGVISRELEDRKDLFAPQAKLALTLVASMAFVDPWNGRSRVPPVPFPGRMLAHTLVMLKDRETQLALLVPPVLQAWMTSWVAVAVLSSLT